MGHSEIKDRESTHAQLCIIQFMQSLCYQHDIENLKQLPMPVFIE